MDKYLESLVRKTELTADPDSEPDVKEQADSAESIDNTPVNTDSNSVEPESNFAEESSVEPEVQAADPVEITATESAVSEPDSESSEPASTEPSECDKIEIGDILNLVNVKIYSSPDTKSKFKIFSGNAEFVGNINGFKVILYVKHGFGTVKGYITESGN